MLTKKECEALIDQETDLLFSHRQFASDNGEYLIGMVVEVDDSLVHINYLDFKTFERHNGVFDRTELTVHGPPWTSK